MDTVQARGLNVIGVTMTQALSYIIFPTVVAWLADVCPCATGATHYTIIFRCHFRTPLGNRLGLGFGLFVSFAMPGIAADIRDMCI